MQKKTEIQYDMFDHDVNALVDYMLIQMRIRKMAENLNYSQHHHDIKILLDYVNIFINDLEIKVKNEKSKDLAK